MARLISLHVVNPVDGTTITDPLLEQAYQFRKTSQYPGGLYGGASFLLPRDIAARPTMLGAGMEVTVRLYTDDQWALDPVYHGWVDELEQVKVLDEAHTRVVLVGDWGRLMMRRGIERRWADTDISPHMWVRDTTASAAEKATDDRDERIRITPKAAAWVSGEDYILSYQTPTGETIGKVTNSYDMQEAAQQWRLRLYNGLADEWTITTSSTGTQDVDLGTAICQLILEAAANQTGASDGTYYGQVSNLVVYASRDHASATLGTVNLYQIALDIIDRLGVDETEISANLANLQTTGMVSLVPFVSSGYEMYGSILARAAAYGDSSGSSFGFGLLQPWRAPDNLPALMIESYPALTDYEYDISVDECDMAVRTNLDDVYNYIIVQYTNRLGKTATLTPADEATLEDATSQGQYGVRERKITLDLANDEIALAYGERYLARHAQPTYAVTRPLRAFQLRAKHGGWVHAGQIDAGSRLRISDLPDLIGQQSPGGQVFLIVATDYDHETESVQLSLGGRPDNLALWLANLQGQLPA